MGTIRVIPQSKEVEIKKRLETLNISLPTEKSKVETDISKFSMFIYGGVGVGKTTFTGMFPNAFHLMFEPGGKTQEMYQVHPENWEEAKGYVDLLDENNNGLYKNVIVDTVDLMFDMCSKSVCKFYGVNFLKELDFGDGYATAGNWFRDVLIQLHRQRGLILLAHDKSKMKLKDSDPDFIIPSTMGTGSKVIMKWVDLVGHYFLAMDGKRYLEILPSVKKESKQNIKFHFKYTDETPIRMIDMGSNEEEAYINFMDAFDNKLENPNIKTTKPKFKI